VRLSFRSAELKLIDFGSACKEDQTVYTYIQVEFCFTLILIVWILELLAFLLYEALLHLCFVAIYFMFLCLSEIIFFEFEIINFNVMNLWPIFMTAIVLRIIAESILQVPWGISWAPVYHSHWYVVFRVCGCRAFPGPSTFPWSWRLWYATIYEGETRVRSLLRWPEENILRSSVIFYYRFHRLKPPLKYPIPICAHHIILPLVASADTYWDCLGPFK
jgi:hypothetical protein